MGMRACIGGRGVGGTRGISPSDAVNQKGWVNK